MSTSTAHFVISGEFITQQAHTLFTDVQNRLIRAYCTEKSIELPYWLEDKEGVR